MFRLRSAFDFALHTMKSDNTRSTFAAARHYSRVIRLQGRPFVDADANEQADILLDYLRKLARDVIGPAGGPVGTDPFGLFGIVSKPGFEIVRADPEHDPFPDLFQDSGFRAASGRYYVQGIMVENEALAPILLPEQNPGDTRDLRTTEPDPSLDRGALFYLDVWERLVTWLDDPHMRDAALGRADSAARSQVAWEVRCDIKLDLDSDGEIDVGKLRLAAFAKLLERDDWSLRATLQADLKEPPNHADPCALSPDARFRGMENQLYRVEIHEASLDGGVWKASLKWSRENGSVVAPLRYPPPGAEASILTIQSVPQRGGGFAAGDIIEVLSAADEMAGRSGQLTQIASVDGERLCLTEPVQRKDWHHVRVRRWDHRPVKAADKKKLLAIPITLAENEKDDPWVELECGIQVRFWASEKADMGETNRSQFRPGDYWQIPARVATGQIEWPLDPAGRQREKLGPFGVRHFYAPLAVLQSVGEPVDLRRIFKVLEESDTKMEHTLFDKFPRSPAPPASPAPPPSGDRAGKGGRAKRR
ncbi:hypothetical protein AYO49_03675 [Verrucomicrobiaceae bacterium SCGC AG-212-N21]|nr:hypothetical protein AYO49_03675 [Verrucomicrobiaceae bacterium SCGC AG-212-N21]